MMEFRQEEELREPVSPTGQLFNSSVLSISILCVLESEVPITIDESQAMWLLKNVFLPINPRFSSIMVRDKNGVQQWKKVEVNLKDHINFPIFPSGMSLQFYDKYLDDYLSKVAMEQLPQSQPLWEIHMIKYPTSNSAGNIIFKLHHALGDGFSLMGALLSCLQRADNPSLPLTFPSLQSNSKMRDNNKNIYRSVHQVFSFVFNSVLDFGWSLLKSSFLEDDRTPIRSGDAGIEFRPITMTTITFSIDQVKQIKDKLGVTINDVITGIIFLGSRLYMQAASPGSGNLNSTALVLLNTRNLRGYKSVEEMAKPDTETPWGNQFGFLHVPIPELTGTESSNPLNFVWKAHRIIKRKRSSFAVFLTGRLLETMRQHRGSEVASSHILTTLKNSSMGISNVIGPLEQMALANHPIRGLYFMLGAAPQNLTVTVISYMGKLRVAVGMEKGFIDPHKFKSSVENAYEIIFKAACKAPSHADSI